MVINVGNMVCNVCKKNIDKQSVKDACCSTGLSKNEREELEYLRKWKRREEEHLKKLIGSPVYKKYIDEVPVQGLGCTLNFI